jgi:hypothetical protein
MQQSDRREFLKLAGIAGVTFTAGLFSGGRASARPGPDFHFVQFSDTHWGYRGRGNPEPERTLEKAFAIVNALPEQPDFIVFSGDLTHSTTEPELRRSRMTQFKEIVSALRVKDLRFLPGEHDALLDRGQAYRELFGPSYYSFDHKGVHFIALDNASDPDGKLGDEQLAWLSADLSQRDRHERIVVLGHRPLFDLQPNWGWSTPDGASAVALLMPYPNVAVFYGHIHQEHHHATGHIIHHAATSLIYPLPAPGSQPALLPLLYDATKPGRGLGTRDVTMAGGIDIVELPLAKS